MSILWSAFEAPGREWRKVFKALGLLEHLIKHGTELVVEDSRDRIHRIRSLTHFSFFEGSNDKGSGIREKSKQLLDLLRDNDCIREERNKARKLRNKFVGVGGGGGGYSDYAAGGGAGTYNDSYNSGGGGYPNHGSSYNRYGWTSPSRREASSSTTGRYRDDSPRTGNDYRHDNEYARHDDISPCNEGDIGKHPSTLRSSKQNVEDHGSKIVEDPSNTGKSTKTPRSTATTLPPSSGSGKGGEDLLGAENDFADFSSAPPVTALNMVDTPEEDEWDAFKSSSPAPVPMLYVPVDAAIKAQPLSDTFQGGNSALPEPQAFLAEMPPQQQISQHDENPFNMLAMGEQQQVPHQQQQQVGFGSTGLDVNSSAGRRPSMNSTTGNNQEWGSFIGRPGSFTGGIVDFQAAPSGGGGSIMSSIGKGGMNNNGSSDLSSLVNLGGLQTNDLQRRQSLGGKDESLDSGRTSSSFRGLDGFTAQAQGSMFPPGSNMNNGGGLSQSGGLNTWPPASPSYSVQQPQQYEVLKGMSSEHQAGAAGLPQQQQQQMSQSGLWPIMVQSQPGMMGSGIPPDALHQNCGTQPPRVQQHGHFNGRYDG
eukprot:26134_1